MLRARLERHAESPSGAVSGIGAELARVGSEIGLRFVAAGVIADIILPPPTASARADGLWRHSCFEAFVRAAPGGPYYELNLAPSTRWAAYRFDGYRKGMIVADAVGAPGIRVASTDSTLELTARFALDGRDLPPDAAWQIGLSAVIEEAGGRLSHWALAHPPGRPDFHHDDCFALELPPAEAI